MGRLDLQVVQQTGQIIDECLGARAFKLVIGVAESTMVEGDAPVALGEEGYLLPPAQQVPPGSVGEDDGFPFPIALIV